MSPFARFVPLALRLPSDVWVLHERGMAQIVQFAPAMGDSGTLEFRSRPPVTTEASSVR